ncbi:ComEC/Rec2 family competence protein [Pengzhenrongella frigida]|uniref:MBL fold metallo-hydrolase n=1 Tax=Pengzhenrongella frigida TaxID=1259133 RepID=A0A4Q5N6W4_9MICO|nr:MBL fold metallo-hydrolase [Cellulomonas sp. HLT2-17]RYV52091.1 MBL fold metallo-hydrolase [Cellulomonas sp. HLT2-17]
MVAVAPVEESTLEPPGPGRGTFVDAVDADPQALLYFLLNVGDGDTQLLVLPPNSNDSHRRVVVVDVATRAKLPALLEALAATGILTEPPGSPGQIQLLVASHPHRDHIGGFDDLLDRYNGPSGCIDQFWEPGFSFPNPSFYNLMRRLDTSPWIRRLQPTGGTAMYLDSVKVTVLGPGVGLRTRFDTHGVGVNDASLTIMIDYPGTSIVAEPDPDHPGRINRRATTQRSRRLLLGGDAQFTSWAQTTIDFPDLVQEFNPDLARELRAARGRDYLAADVLKVSHHASKHGVTLELLERVGARYALVSAVAGGGKYNFPHALTMDAAREARTATATSGAAFASDHELGIHVTGAVLAGAPGRPAGSIGLLIPARAQAPLRMFRFLDAPKEAITLAAAREVRR